MKSVNVDEALWRNAMLPEGILERWYVADQAIVAEGDMISEIRIEGARHEITAPAAGRITLLAHVNDVVEPGTQIAQLA